MDTVAGRDDDELAVGRHEGVGVAVQDVHEGGAEVGASPQPKDHHGVAAGAVRGWELCFEHRRGGEEQASIRLQRDHLVGGELAPAGRSR